MVNRKRHHDDQEISEQEKKNRIENFVEATSSDEAVAISKLSKYNWDVNAAVDSILNDKSAFSDFQNALLGSKQKQSEPAMDDVLDMDDICEENADFDYEEDDEDS